MTIPRPDPRRFTTLARATAVVCAIFIAAHVADAQPKEPAPPATSDGTITASLKIDDTKVLKATAILRKSEPIGIVSVKFTGTIVGDKAEFKNLPVPGQYDLEFQTTEGILEGWNANVPRSDYEEEQPLSDESRKALALRMSKDSWSGFGDDVKILDMQGNIHNAAFLLLQVRTRAFDTSFGQVSDEIVWRVDRHQWEFTNEINWNPDTAHPYYALDRQRIKRDEFSKRSYSYARHLGGFELTAKKPSLNAGILRISKIQAGIHAINPDGNTVAPVVIKPRPDPSVKPRDFQPIIGPQPMRGSPESQPNAKPAVKESTP